MPKRRKRVTTIDIQKKPFRDDIWIIKIQTEGASDCRNGGVADKLLAMFARHNITYQPYRISDFPRRDSAEVFSRPTPAEPLMVQLSSTAPQEEEEEKEEKDKEKSDSVVVSICANDIDLSLIKEFVKQINRKEYWTQVELKGIGA